MQPDILFWNGRQRAARLAAAFAALTLCSCMDAGPDGSATSDAAPAAQATSASDPCDELATTGTKLVELGHTKQIVQVEQSGQRIASRDASGWRLWDAATGKTVARGSGSLTDRIDLVGDTLLTTESGNLQLRSAQDGALQRTIPFAGPLRVAKLSHDGTYVYAVGESTVDAWDLAGTPVAQAAVDKGVVVLHAASREIVIVRKQPTKQVDIVSIETGETRNAGAYEGDFAGWFRDGGHFVTFGSQPREFLVYTKDAQLVQRIPCSRSTRAYFSAGGEGKYVWLAMGGTGSDWFEVRELESPAAPVLEYSGMMPLFTSQRSSMIALTQRGSEKQMVVDLRGDAPKATALPTTTSAVESVSVDDSGRVVSTSGTLFYAGALLSSAPPRPYGCGAVLGLAGWRDRLAVSSESGVVRLFSFSSGAPVLRWKLTDTYGSTPEFIGDGRYLLVRGRFVDPATKRETLSTRTFALDEDDQGLRSHQVHQAPGLSLGGGLQTSVATNAPSYALTLCASPFRPGSQCEVFVRTLDGSEWRKPYDATVWSATPQLAPGGRLLAVPEREGPAGVSSALYDGWTRTGRLPGLRIDLWLTDERAVATDTIGGQLGATQIIDLAGATHGALASPPLGRLRKGSDGVFHDAEHVYSDADGAVLWSLQRATGRALPPDAPTTTVAGRFVFADAEALFAEPYASAPDQRSNEPTRRDWGTHPPTRRNRDVP